MIFYICPRCGYEINIKTKYVNHLRRKKLCDEILSKTNLQTEYIKYGIKEKIISPQNNTMEPTKNVEFHKITQNNTKINKCKYCDKQFSRIDSLNRHYKTCKENKKIEEANENMQELVNLLNEQKLELKEKNKQIDELIKKAGINIGTQNIQQNINQNIKILAYDNTDLSHLKNKDYLKCLKRSNFCIPHLIEKIHFNPEKPENHNIYISNLKNNYVMIYNGEKWMINDRDESIQNLIDDKESIIEQKLEEWIENGKNYPDIMKKFNRYLEKKENDTVLNKIKNEIKLMLFNNRDIVSKKQ